MTTWETAHRAAAERPPRGLRDPRGLRGVRALCRPVAAATLLAAALHAVWALLLAADAGDLAAQYAWTEFIRQHPESAYNLSWYGGMHPASYSLLTPYLMGVLGVRTTGVLAGTAAAALAAGLLVRTRIARPLAPALWTAFALWCNVLSGRVTFAVGIAFGLAAVLVAVAPDRRKVPSLGRPVPRAGRTAGALALAALATAGSPVAGLFLGVVAAGLRLTGARRSAAALGAGPALVVGGTALAFPFEGVQPFDWWVAVPVSASAAAVALLVPRGWRTVRAGAAVYALGVVVTWVVPSPVGSNVERLSLLFAGTVLLAAALQHRRAGRRALTLAVAFLAVAVWQTGKPVGDLLAADLLAADPSVRTARSTLPLLDELRRIGADRGRIEVVPLRSHREASGLAPHVNLARGWNRQVDVVRNPLFYDDSLTADSYHAWLRHWSVGYVVLPVAQLDDAAVREAEIVARGQTWLDPIWRDDGWRLYRVADPLPLVEPPATVREAGPAALTLDVPRAGPVLLRVPWSPWLGIEGVEGVEGTGGVGGPDRPDRPDRSGPGGPSPGCLAEAGEWTVLYAPGPGTYRIGGRYGLPRGNPCADGGSTVDTRAAAGPGRAQPG
ncbi:MFS transporter [Kitasatospora sp. NPDC088346]|uniref:MFS transporter n=1 Tax=Kitasatospora sp. NPDC088346 TaxID=3364073 RepID=UPI003802FC79